MSSPTAADITKVQNNLKNMQELNDYVHNYGQDKITNAYLLLSEHDKSDPGLKIVLSIMKGAFGKIGSSIAGPVGSIVGNFLAGLISSWYDKPPADIKGSFASYVNRFSKTCIAVDTQLAAYHANVVGNWEKSFTFEGSTTTLSELATIAFPDKTDPKFLDLAKAVLLGLDRNLWQQMLDTYKVITFWQDDPMHPLVIKGDKSTPPTKWVQSFYAKNPAYYCIWGWHEGSGCTDYSGWIIKEYSLGTEAQLYKDNSLNIDACKYLFKDSTPGVVINPDGLFTREEVFNSLNIKEETYKLNSGSGYLPNPSSRIPAIVDMATTPTLSKSYLRAHKEGKSLSKLIETEGREKVQQKIIAKAASDSVFAHNLSVRPYQTLEEFLGVKIPEVLDLKIVVEGGKTFGLVIPEPDYSKV
ncbi:hypothetical protein [Mastigocoleus testarum]|uniref:Uncharacterized protein n=1 Tax=Mastigocoleus testarum BC008 TaxID=371196 RepID=A0A0V7ZQ28_9CYAN|nr:hypothetical protein [Mastigocoleus testarum]KST66360.1 hypothetical protein BC008_25655 [Mastigocoleus testarum BC008]KST66681.1 hypothetical protein BC008_26180 [Mastigocoleus testarum BC008]